MYGEINQTADRLVVLPDGYIDDEHFSKENQPDQDSRIQLNRPNALQGLRYRQKLTYFQPFLSDTEDDTR